ncbi:MAG TPA: hypothetical protein VNZ26_34485 [Vicinamibacterales bacterium]|nr:hypothetical protein [Vicinamibacterales bacterium]
MTKKWLDVLLAIGVAFVAAIWGTAYWNASWKAGRQPSFYQEYFEPAVMTACGRGFVVATPSIAELNDFLVQKRDSFDCGEIPAATTYRAATFQAPWRYLMWAVAINWQIRGISWSGLGPLSGLLFGASIALAFAIFRLGMGRLFALGGAAMFAVAPIHLVEVPHLRDYSKAPFALACLFILGVLASRRLHAYAFLAISTLYGVIAGIGYGFRSDLLIFLPPFVVVVAAFLPDGFTKHLGLKAVAVLGCASGFVAAAWPIITVAQRNGSCLWHFALLGFTDTFTQNLRLLPGPYDWGHKFSDRWVYGSIAAYAERQHPDLGLIPYCSPVYDRVGREYFVQIVKTFPGDIVTRACASILGIFRESFWRPDALPGFAPGMNIWRDRLLRHLPGTGLVWVSMALVISASTDLRLGLFLLFLMLFFGGYPSIQFHPRHQFYLELIPWWAAGFVVYHTCLWAWRWTAPDRSRPLVDVAAVRRGVLFGLSVVAILIGTLVLLRAFQDRQVGELFDAYLASPRETLALDRAAPGQLHALPMPTGQVYPSTFLEVDFRPASCGPQPSVTFRYEPRPDAELSRTVIADNRDSSEVTRVFAPVYEYFRGLEFSDEREGCVVSVRRVTDTRALPLLLNATLDPGWRREPLHERIANPWSALQATP